MIELRAVETEVDVQAFLEVRRRVDPDNPITRENFDDGRQKPDRLDRLAVLESEVVGAAWANLMPGDESRFAYVSVRVVPERRRRGVGTALFRRVSEHARDLGRARLYTVTRHDDPDTRDYLAKRGYEELTRMEDVALDPREARPAVDSPEGVEIVPLGEREELERGMFAVGLEADADIPTAERHVISDFDRWRERNLAARVLRELSFVALEHGEVVGFATLGGDTPGVGVH